MFVTVVIEAHKERNNACFDIPGVFLHANSDKDITMILKGRLAELMVKVAPIHSESTSQLIGGG